MYVHGTASFYSHDDASFAAMQLARERSWIAIETFPTDT